MQSTAAVKHGNRQSQPKEPARKTSSSGRQVALRRRRKNDFPTLVQEAQNLWQLPAFRLQMPLASLGATMKREGRAKRPGPGKVVTGKSPQTIDPTVRDRVYFALPSMLFSSKFSFPFSIAAASRCRSASIRRTSSSITCDTVLNSFCVMPFIYFFQSPGLRCARRVREPGIFSSLGREISASEISPLIIYGVKFEPVLKFFPFSAELML